MDLLSLTAGITLITVTIVDMVWTVVAVGEGAGPVSGHVSSGLWSGVLWFDRRVRHSELWLRLGGVVVVLLSLGVWIVGLWAGWWLVFINGSIIDPVSGEAADGWGRLYYAGYTLFTMGNGDLVPNGSAWRVTTAVANLIGLVLITLGVTYLVPVARAATMKRALATRISALGGTPQEIVTRLWDGHGFTALELHAGSLVEDLSQIAQLHLAYPVLHYFHAAGRHQALPPRVAALDDALTVMAEGVAPEIRPARGVIEPAREAIHMFLETLRSAYITPETAVPPVLDPEPLRRVGIPIVDSETLAQAFAQNEHRRRLAAAFVHHDGWSWSDAVVQGRSVVEDELPVA